MVLNAALDTEGLRKGYSCGDLAAVLPPSPGLTDAGGIGSWRLRVPSAPRPQAAPAACLSTRCRPLPQVRLSLLLLAPTRAGTPLTDGHACPETWAVTRLPGLTPCVPSFLQELPPCQRRARAQQLAACCPVRGPGMYASTPPRSLRSSTFLAVLMHSL